MPTVSPGTCRFQGKRHVLASPPGHRRFQGVNGSKAMNEPYIRAGEAGIDFYYLFSLFDFEDLPIVFVCRDDSQNLYLCNCTEFRFETQEWTIASTDESTINDVAEGRKSVYDALAAGSALLATYTYADETYQQEAVAFADIPETRLPDRDSRITISNQEKERILNYAI